jgi:hypothetical protein
LPDARGADGPLLSIYAFRTCDDGQIAVYISHGTVSQPEEPRRFLWEDTESGDAGASLAAVCLAWVHRHEQTQELPFG